ncbi:hypothetical protein K439DRAFT_1611492 [Ramaria rubella]|nr:hypothetical protein K439DRAFT_1611492 [Ramaria rubella]
MNRDPVTQPCPGIFNFNRIPTALECLRSSLSPGRQAFTASSHFNFHTQALLLNLHARTLPAMTFFLHAEYEVERGRGVCILSMECLNTAGKSKRNCTWISKLLLDVWIMHGLTHSLHWSFLSRYTVPALEMGLEHVVAVPHSPPGHGGSAHMGTYSCAVANGDILHHHVSIEIVLCAPQLTLQIFVLHGCCGHRQGFTYETGRWDTLNERSRLMQPNCESKTWRFPGKKR